MAKSVSKRIAIVGGGMSGLTSIKACLEEGLEPVCFEGTEDIGGLWRYRKDQVEGISSLAKTTVINTSKEISAFSDFTPPIESPVFMPNRDMCRYFELYADKFQLRKYIKFNHKVSWITPTEDFDVTGRWSVTVVNSKNTEVTEIYDGVMICSGHHVIPHFPKFPGLDSFKGKVIHTHDYKVPNEFVDKNVMVVGTGNSGSDATIETSGVARQTYLSTRRGFWIMYRVGEKGYPYDMRLLNRAYQALPPRLLNYLEEKRAQSIIDYKKFGMQASHALLSQHPTASDALPNKIICGAVKIKGPISKFVPEGVIFEDENQVTPMDAVIFATGYDVGFPFLDPKVAKLSNEVCELYMYVFPPHLKHPTLGFIGNIQPIGPLFPISELHARWYAQVVTGNFPLPPKSVMLESIRQKAEFNKTNFISGTRHTTEVLYIPFCDEIAAHFGAKPNFKKIFLTDPVLATKLIFGPVLPYQYRLQGPHKWAGARDAILKVQSRVDGALKTNTKLVNQLKNQPKEIAILTLAFWALALIGILIAYFNF